MTDGPYGAPPPWPPVPPPWPPGPQPWPPAGPPPRQPSNAARYVVAAALAVLMVAFAVLVVVTREQWAGGAPVAGTKMTFLATQQDGSPPTAEELTRAKQVVNDRIAALGIAESSVVADGDTVTVTVPGDGREVSEIAGEASRFDLRPVIHIIPAEGGTGAGGTPPTPPPPRPDDAERLKNEKQLRQSATQSVQILALQFQATRCGEPDPLAGKDDPELPLVTCSQDGTEVYLLDTSIIDGDQIAGATSGFDEQSGQYVVDLEFDDQAAQTWANFTSANIGTRTAFVLDTAVVSAPQIMEAIPGGHTQISGQFSEASARELAAVLDGGSLPLTLTVESSDAISLPGSEGSTVTRIGLAGAGGVLVLAVIGAVTFFAVSGRRRRQ